VFEAVNAITGDYEPYLGTIVAPPGASAKAAAVAAAHGVLKNYFPDSATSLDLARTSSLAAIPNGQAKYKGIAVGEAAAAAMIADRANDGSASPQFYMPPSANPGEWQTTPGCPPAGGIFLHWRNLTPFGNQSSDQFRSAPPPALTSNRYRKGYNEVKDVGELNSTERPQDRTDVARYFAVVGAPHVWNQAVSQVSAAQGKSLSENARAFALLNMAISDGLVSSMETKYHYVFWRPYTAIRAGNTDGNRKTDPDVAWTTFIPTPCFPSYPSAHASGSYAGRAIIEKIFGRGSHDITLSHPGIPDVILHYTKFSQITRDIDDARVYGGIHFRFDQEAGGRQGRQVGSYVYKHNLRRCGNHDKDCGGED
jgi:PAP2 superfamily